MITLQGVGLHTWLLNCILEEEISMKKKALVVLMVAMITSLAGCKKEEVPIESSSLAVIEPEPSSEEFIEKLPDKTEDLVVGTVEAIVVGEDGQALSESEAAILESESEKEAESRAEGIKAAQETAETSETLDSSLSESEALEKHDRAMKEKMADGETLSNEELAKVTNDVDAYYTEKARVEYLESVKRDLALAKEKGIEKYAGITEEELESYNLEQLSMLSNDLFYDLQ